MDSIVSITQFDGKCQNLQMSPIYFYTSFYCFRIIKFKKNYLQKLRQSHGE